MMAGTQGGAVNIELQSGALGSIRLSLSPRIQQQLANPSRTIDVAANKDTVAKGNEAVSQNSQPGNGLKMLGLTETRKLADGTPLNTLDKPKTAADRFAEMLSEVGLGSDGS